MSIWLWDGCRADWLFSEKCHSIYLYFTSIRSADWFRLQTETIFWTNMNLFCRTVDQFAWKVALQYTVFGPHEFNIQWEWNILRIHISCECLKGQIGLRKKWNKSKSVGHGNTHNNNKHKTMEEKESNNREQREKKHFVHMRRRPFESASAKNFEGQMKMKWKKWRVIHDVLYMLRWLRWLRWLTVPEIRKLHWQWTMEWH